MLNSNILVLIMLLFSFLGCSSGGNSAGNPTEEIEEVDTAAIEKELSLPPDPGAEADTTVLGIDSNDNDIRDEVERKIAFKHFPEIPKIIILNKKASLWQQSIKPENIDNPNYQRKNNNEIGLLVGCSYIIYGDDLNSYRNDRTEVSGWLHNTNERLSEKSKARSHIHGQEFILASDEEFQIYCDELLGK